MSKNDEDGAVAEPDGASVAEQLREALRFLSHDAREGHSSTLALIELQRVRAESMSAGDLAQRIERNARRSLMRIDDFVAFARARSQVMQPEELDLLDLIYDAVAECWHAGNERGVRLKVGQAPSEALVQADRGLLRAAITRLIQHALERCRRGSDLVCTVHAQAPTPPAQHWSVELDEAFKGGDDEAPAAALPAPEGEHGWALVELVVHRMHGEVRQLGDVENGVHVRMGLPRA